MLPTEFTLKQMQAVYEQYKRDFSHLEAQCKAAVVETRIANDRMICPRPLFDQIAKNAYYWSIPRRRWVASEVETAMVYKHGFDKDGVLRTYEHNCLFYNGDYIDEVNRMDVTRYVLNERGVADVIYEFSSYGGGSFAEERFVEEAGRVTKSITKQVWLNDEQLSAHDFEDICTFEYDEQGFLIRVVEEAFRDGTLLRATLKYARPRGETLEAASRALEDFLVEQIPKSVQQFQADSRLFAVLICYCGEDIASGWPGYLAVANEETRDQHLHGHPDDIWMVEEWWQCSWLDPHEPAARLDMEEKALRVLQLVDSPDVWLSGDRVLLMRQILHRAALRLNRVDWSTLLPVTDDFVVAVIDNTGDYEQDEDLAASVPPEKIAVLQSSGFLKELNA